MGLSESIMDEENIEYWEYAKDGERILDYLFTVRLTDAFTKILDTSLVQNELLMESIFNEKYKKITVLKKNGKPYLLERNIEKGEHSTFIELQKKYPHSEIKVKNYNGKTTKYEVKEKIKLDQNGPK